MSELSVVLGDYPHTRALHAGTRPSTLQLNLLDLAETPQAISQMLDEQVYDACEMPIVSFLQAWFDKRPLCLLPVAMVRRRQHAAAIYDSAHGEMTPDDLAGRRIGVRSWTRTTGVWVRGILAHDHGMDPGSIDWVTTHGSHIEPVHDPSRRAPAGKSIAGMLSDGELDVAIGEQLDRPSARPLISDPERAGQRWCERNGFVPINHVVVVRERLLHESPERVALLYAALLDAWHRASPDPSFGDVAPFGLAANHRALGRAVAYAAEQGIITHPVEVDRLLDARLPGSTRS